MEGQEAVAHLAAIIPPLSDQRPDFAREVNVGGTRNIVQAMKRAGARRLVFTSSVAVFAKAQPRPPPRTADDPLGATDPYSHHKLECEGMIRGSELEFCILRFGAVVPPAVPSLDFRVQIRMAFEIPVEQRMEVVDAQDAGLAVANAVATAEAGGKTLLIGGGASSQLLFRDYMGAMLEAMGLRMFPDEAFGAKPFHTDWMDTSEAQRLLRFQRHTFADFMKRYRAERALFRPLVNVVRPVIWPFLLRLSPHWKKRRQSGAL